MASFEHRGLIGRIYVGDDKTLPHSKYIVVGLMVSEKKIFNFFFHYKSMGANDPQSVASLELRGLTGRIYVQDL